MPGNAALRASVVRRGCAGTHAQGLLARAKRHQRLCPQLPAIQRGYRDGSVAATEDGGEGVVAIASDQPVRAGPDAYQVIARASRDDIVAAVLRERGRT